MTLERALGTRPMLVVRLGGVVSAWVVWALFPSAWWVVPLAGVPVLVTVMRERDVGSPLVSACLGALLVTAVIGVWASYDPHGGPPVFAHPAGWRKLWGLILATWFFYALVTVDSAQGQRWGVGLLAALGALVGVSFVVTNDWMAQSALWQPIWRLGKAIQLLLPLLPRGALNPNVAAGIVAPLLPLSIGLTVQAWRVHDRVWIAWGSLTTAAMGLALVLTASRGAWLATAAAVALAAVWWAAGRLAHRGQRLAIFASTVALGIVAAGLVLGLITPLRRLILGSGPIANRLAIFSQATLLVRDYAFTGSGLGTFPVVHSTYALLIHVPVLSHAHALPLNVAVEQGLIGAEALMLAWAVSAWIGLRALARSQGDRPMLAAAQMSLTVLVIHSLADDALYSSRGVLFLWVPVATVLSSARDEGRRRRAAGDGPAKPQAVDGGRDDGGEPGRRRDGRLRWIGVVAPLVAMGALLATVGRPLAAAFHANLGAIYQTQVELEAYDPARFDDPTLDEVRQQADLSTASESLKRALLLDPGQVTARTRLSQIALARRDYEAALEHARAAWDAGYRDRVTRLALGDALVAHGRIEEAARVCRGLERTRTRLEGQAFYRYQRRGDWRRAAYAWRTLLALDPGNQRARSAAERAEAKAGDE